MEVRGGDVSCYTCGQPAYAMTSRGPICGRHLLTEERAKELFEVYKEALPNANIKLTWEDLPEEMKAAWRKVAAWKLQH